MHRNRAFTLLETLVALAILGIALASSIALMAQYQVLDRRVSGHLEAQRCFEAQVEALRGGLLLPLDEGEHLLPAQRPAQWPVESMRYRATVEHDDTPGLFFVELVGSYEILGRAFERRVELYLWRPI